MEQLQGAEFQPNRCVYTDSDPETKRFMRHKRTDMTRGYVCVCVCVAWAYLLLRGVVGISKHMSAGIIVSERESERERDREGEQ